MARRFSLTSSGIILLEGHRYAALREQFPKRPWLMFFGFSQYQAALLGLLSAPFAIACSNAAPRMSGWEVGGLILWLAAIAGETVANLQLRRFRSNQANSGKVCDAGLWRYSRHPDCFFEWLIWVAYFIFAVGSPWGWVTVYCPLIMLYFLTKVTGVPPAEARSLKSLGERIPRLPGHHERVLPRPAEARSLATAGKRPSVKA